MKKHAQSKEKTEKYDERFVVPIKKYGENSSCMWSFRNSGWFQKYYK